jgi:AraC-like DNA-binding protein/tetratricopeptide (TPR) repeat protein
MPEPLTTDQLLIRKLVDIVVNNLGSENFGVNELAHESGMSRARLNRRLNAITKKSINQFIREVRLEKALELLKNESVTVSEVTFRVGFRSPNYFNTCFREYFGFPPGKVTKSGSESQADNLLTHFIPERKENKTVWKILAFHKTWILVVSGLIAVVVLVLYPKLFKRDAPEDLGSSDGRISVAVMPFQNMTNDTIWNVWQDGIQDILITSLSNSGELKVRQRESVNAIFQSKSPSNFTSITPSVASNISRKLDANIFIIGSINKEGALIRVNAQLIDSRTEEVFKSFQIDGQDVKILPMIDTLSRKINDYLIISKLKKNLSPDFQQYVSSNSPEAFTYFLYGNIAYNKHDWFKAIEFFLQAVAIDSSFDYATIRLASAYWAKGLYKEGKKWCLKVYERKDQMPLQLRLWTERTYSLYFETPYEEIKCLRKLLEIDDQAPYTYYGIGRAYLESLQEYERSIPELEKSLEIYIKWNSKPLWVFNYVHLGNAYHHTGQYKKEKNLYEKAKRDFPDDSTLIFRQIVLALFEGKTADANELIEKFKYLLKENSANEATITTKLALIYAGAGILDQAESYYRQALSLQTENHLIMINLAYFLIDNNRNISEGMKLVDRILESEPENYDCLHVKGWGLYKQGKYKEALDKLQKSWDIRREEAVYNHEAFLHLEAVKKAVAGMKQ